MPESLFNFIKKETLAQVFSCEFCEISKNTFSFRTPPVAASIDWNVARKLDEQNVDYSTESFLKKITHY